ncbi:unnamed protein product [Heterobilharzia americana]|nr:unnamed protein product [Heterobilharzia americana]
MSDIVDSQDSPEVAGMSFPTEFENEAELGLSSTLKYERSRYNNASVFLPNTPVIIKIIHSCESQLVIGNESSDEPKKDTLSGKPIPNGSLVLTNQSWYEMKLTHGDFEWYIYRSIGDLKSFYTSFMLERALMSISNKRKENRRKISPFPPMLDMLSGKKLCDRRVMLEKYLQSIIDVQEYRETDLVLRFLEVSPLSFVNCSRGLKLKEDYVHKLPSYNYFNKYCCASNICLQKRWLILKDSYFVYMKQRGDKIKAKDIDKSEKGKLRLAYSFELSGKNRSWRLCNIFLIDQNFAFRTRVVERSGQCQLKLYNSLGELVVICQSESRMNDWNNTLLSHIYQDGTRDFIQYNRFGSFAPPRRDTQICMFIDGACYMEAVAKAIAQAQHEIFITDWCMHPSVFLRRPVRDNTWRLDMLLHAKAKQGVKIYIMLYKESEFAVKFRSIKVKRWLKSLHSNIYVYRSPRSTRLWSHHEKIVAVDQSIVFLGGIDLCFGRWDTNDHRRLVKYGSVQFIHLVLIVQNPVYLLLVLPDDQHIGNYE